MTRIQLIDGWRKAYKFLSVQLALFGAFVCAILSVFPDALTAAWNMIPGDLKAFVPERYRPLIAMALFLLAVIARLVKQPKATVVVAAEAEKQKDKRDA